MYGLDVTAWIVTLGYLLGYVDSFLDDIPHEIVRPVIYHNRQRRSDTYSQNGHIRKFTVVLKTTQSIYTLDLQRSRFLLSPDFKIRTFNADGSEVITAVKEHDQHCHYAGRLRNSPKSVVSVSTCHGVSGMIITDKVLYIHPIDNTTSGRHAIWKGEDEENTFKCGTSDHDHVPKRLKREVNPTAGSINWPDQHGERSKIVELFLVSDFRHYDKYRNNVKERAQETINHVNALYSQLGIYVVLVGMEIWTNDDMIAVTSNSSKTLNDFRNYRMNNINPKFPNDNTQLITGVDFDGKVIGKASIGTMCTNTFSCGVNMDHRRASVSLAATMAHEMGHNFGMSHDNSACTCESDEPCIMAPQSSKEQIRWSSCSKAALKDSFSRGMDYCLHNLPSKTHEGPVCGNGVVETGEECDCGIKALCSHNCCNTTSCKLMHNSTCATGACCDLDICQMKVATTVCREAAAFCDLPEYCTGESEWCPSDVHKYNGLSCENQGDSYCYKGKCQSRSNQCMQIWGPSVVDAHRDCYDFNANSPYSGCDYDPLSHIHTNCKQEDVLCGSLMCNSALDFPTFWKDIYYYPGLKGTKNGGRDNCRAFNFDVGRHTPNPSYAFEGSKCGDKKMCVDRKCTSLEVLGFVSNTECSGHGIQTDRDTCHCDPGYGPPFCDMPGIGGSIFSGPPTNYNPLSTIRAGLIAAIVITICLLLCIPFIACLIAKLRPKFLQKLSRNRPRAQSQQSHHQVRETKTKPVRSVHTVSAPVFQDSTNQVSGNKWSANGSTINTLPVYSDIPSPVYSEIPSPFYNEVPGPVYEVPSPADKDYSVYENDAFVSDKGGAFPYHSNSYQVNQGRNSVDNQTNESTTQYENSEVTLADQLKAALTAFGETKEPPKAKEKKRPPGKLHIPSSYGNVESSANKPTLSPTRPAPRAPPGKLHIPSSYGNVESSVNRPTLSPTRPAPSVLQKPRSPQQHTPGPPQEPHSTTGVKPQRVAPSIPPTGAAPHRVAPKRPQPQQKPSETYKPEVPQRPEISEKPKLMKKPPRKNINVKNNSNVDDSQMNERKPSEADDDVKPAFTHLNKKNKPSLPQKPPRA